MATDPHYRLLTAEEFLQIDFGADMRAERDNGIIRMMAGAKLLDVRERHAVPTDPGVGA